MSLYRIFRPHSASSTNDRSPVVCGRTLTLWIFTFAAGLLFGMLAVLLTSV